MLRPVFYFRSRHPALLARGAFVLIWVSAAIFSALPFISYDLSYKITDAVVLVSWANTVPSLISLAAIMFTAIFVMWVVTIATLIGLRLKKRYKSSITPSCHRRNRNIILIQTRAAIILAIMVGVFSVCMLPTAVSLCIQHKFAVNISNDPKDIFENVIMRDSIDAVLYMVLTSNSLWNFFIYNARDEVFKKQSKILIKKAFCKRSCNQATAASSGAN